MSGRDPISLGDSLGSVVRALRGPQAEGAPRDVRAIGDVFGRWADTVGDAVARHVQPVKLDGHRLVVEVDDPAWATQLRFLEADVLDKLRTVTGAEIDLLEIRVRRR